VFAVQTAFVLDNVPIEEQLRVSEPDVKMNPELHVCVHKEPTFTVEPQVPTSPFTGLLVVSAGHVVMAEQTAVMADNVPLDEQVRVSEPEVSLKPELQVCVHEPPTATLELHVPTFPLVGLLVVSAEHEVITGADAEQRPSLQLP